MTLKFGAMVEDRLADCFFQLVVMANSAYLYHRITANPS
jgi:hypothetical protein